MENETAKNGSRSGFKAWLPVIGLTFSTFIFNTSEFIPIGLLSDIAGDFGITEANAGMLITVYAWVVALASLPLMLIFAKTENRKLMLSITAIFAASHILSGFAKDFYMLMISRIGVACSHAIFWSIVTPLAVRLAPEGKGSTALSIIVCGSLIAMIIGLPLGRTIGLYLGWRATFLIIAVLAAVILAILAAVLPKMPGDGSISLRKLPALIKSPALLSIYLVTVIAITGHFTGYSYIEPFLGQVAGLGSNWITIVLTIFGVVGLAGSWIFSRCYDRYRRRFSGRHLHFPPSAACSGLESRHSRDPLRILGLCHQFLQSLFPVRNHTQRPERHSRGNVHIFRDIQHRNRRRGSHRRLCMLRHFHFLHRICRRGNSPCGSHNMLPENASCNQWLNIFSPTIEMMRVEMKKSLQKVTGSWKKNMPTSTVPTAPMPVQMG